MKTGHGIGSWTARGLAIVSLLAGCAMAPQHKSADSRPLSLQSSSIQDFADSIIADSRQSDITTDAVSRARLAEDAEAKSRACLNLDPKAAACLYYRAVALGLVARAHPLRANESLKAMLEALDAAQAADANYDNAGPYRVKALVLVRAPGWPLGPGDPESGVTAARAAVQLRSQFPPNILALAEALAKTGDAAGAREAFQRAHDLAAASSASIDRDDWLKQAQQGLTP